MSEVRDLKNGVYTHQVSLGQLVGTYHRFIFLPSKKDVHAGRFFPATYGRNRTRFPALY
jgi:hypothetical protein